MESAFPDPSGMALSDAATKRILEGKIRDSERVPCDGDFTAAIFTAPIHVLDCVIALWPSTYRNAVFLTPDELRAWRTIYEAEEPDQDSWWFVFQEWDVQLNPPSDSFWLEDSAAHCDAGMTPVLIVCGLSWGSLAGGQRAELWSIAESGSERFVGIVGDVTF